MSRLNQILACLVSVVMLLLVVEGGLRLIGFAPRPTMNVFDAKLGWTKQPRAEIRRRTSEFDVTLATNSRGLREDESVGYEKPAGVKRILLVGDSSSLGYTVDRPDTISALLEKRLRAEGRNAQVVNAGTEGYSTDQEALWLASEGKRYSPDIAVLQMYENDIYWNAQDHYLRYPKPKLSTADAGQTDAPNASSRRTIRPRRSPRSSTRSEFSACTQSSERRTAEWSRWHLPSDIPIDSSN